ncbi:DUF4381 domain-containing protein [Luteimonas lutimaris]|uniref:DUF4381 domain-containing protein n=1 Tax=Luteimonas lutimaris TaxID=698645 RepID=A0ABP7M9Z0_9GAMM
MIAPQPLPLRDIHQPPAPPWWPPAPGWWWLAAAVLVLLGFAIWWWLRARRRRAAFVRLFDAGVAAAATPPGRVAAMSELLRRAARRHQPGAERLHGEAWLAFLDGNADAPEGRRPFSDGPGRALLDAGFRREVDDDVAAALLPLARRRYLELMGARG